MICLIHIQMVLCFVIVSIWYHLIDDLRDKLAHIFKVALCYINSPVSYYVHISSVSCTLLLFHDDVIKWKLFPRNWPFVRGIHRSPVTQSFDVFFDLRLNQRLSKNGWWFETLSRPLWRHCNEGNRLKPDNVMLRFRWHILDTMV